MPRLRATATTSAIAKTRATHAAAGIHFVDTYIGDPELANLPQLEQLTLDDCALDDAALVALARTRTTLRDAALAGAALAGAALLVNTTSNGMVGQPPLELVILRDQVVAAGIRNVTGSVVGDGSHGGDDNLKRVLVAAAWAGVRVAVVAVLPARIPGPDEHAPHCRPDQP